MARAVAFDEEAPGVLRAGPACSPRSSAPRASPRRRSRFYEKAQVGLTKASPQAAMGYESSIADVLRELGDYKRAEPRPGGVPGVRTRRFYG